MWWIGITHLWKSLLLTPPIYTAVLIWNKCHHSFRKTLKSQLQVVSQICINNFLQLRYKIIKGSYLKQAKKAQLISFLKLSLIVHCKNEGYPKALGWNQVIWNFLISQTVRAINSRIWWMLHLLCRKWIQILNHQVICSKIRFSTKNLRSIYLAPRAQAAKSKTLTRK